jgi:putative endonuclease
MALPKQSRNIRPVPRSPTEQQAIGQNGEEQALAYLRDNGLTLIERNYHCRIGEIDLIMLDRGVLVFVEVRKRSSMRYGGAAVSVAARKQAKLVSAAKVFLTRYSQLPECRFDVIAIDAEKVEWLKNVIHT